MKYFLNLDADNRVIGVYSEEYIPDGLQLVEVSEETAKLPSTTPILNDWLFYNNTLEYDPLPAPQQLPLFIQVGV